MRHFILIGILTVVCLPSQAAFAQEEAIEVYVEGKKFGSLDDYKLMRLKESILAAFPSSNEEGRKIIIEKIYQDFHPREAKSFSEEELRLLITQLYDEKFTLSKQEDVSELTQMQEMLDEAVEGLKDLEPMTIDPKKMKTIEIKPSAD